MLQDKSLCNQKISGRPPLNIAADYGQTKILELLLDKGAEINVSTKY